MKLRHIVLLLSVSCAVVACIPEKIDIGLSKAADKLSEGLKGVDPLALQTLVAENAALRDKLVGLQAQLSGATEGTGVIVVKGRRLQVEVEQYSGSLRVDGWVDTPANWFWQNRRFDDKAITLPIKYKEVIEGLLAEKIDQINHLSVIKGIPEATARQVLCSNLDQIADRYQQVMSQAFSTFLSTSALIPGPDERSVDLQDQLITTGMHIVVLRVTPMAVDSNGKWSVRGRILTVSPNGEKSVVKVFDVDSTSNPSHALGNPTPDVIALLHVKTTL